MEKGRGKRGLRVKCSWLTLDRPAEAGKAMAVLWYPMSFSVILRSPDLSHNRATASPAEIWQVGVKPETWLEI